MPLSLGPVAAFMLVVVVIGCVGWAQPARLVRSVVLSAREHDAVRAALDMSKRLVVVNQKLEQQGYGPLRHGIGVHTGTVVAANIDSEDRLSYAMVGDTVNLASRLQALTKDIACEVLFSEATFHHLDKTETVSAGVEPVPPMHVKGKRLPVACYKII